MVLKVSGHDFFSKPLKILIIFPIETSFESNFIDNWPSYTFRLQNSNSSLYVSATGNSGIWKWSTIPFMCLLYVSKFKVNTNLMVIGGNVAEV